MILDLEKIFTGEEKDISFNYLLDLSSTAVGGSFPFVSPVKIVGTVTGKEGFADIMFRTAFQFSIPCDRCAVQIDRSLLYSFSHTLVPSLENEDDDRFIEVRDSKLDLDVLVREDILLELPTKFLCRSDCKGICPTCGKNLNEGPCGCKNEQGDERFEILKNLIH